MPILLPLRRSLKIHNKNPLTNFPVEFAVADTNSVSLKLRAKFEQTRFDLIRTDLGLCLTFATVAETADRMGNPEYADRCLTKAEKGNTDMLRSFSQATIMTAEVETELQSKFKQVRDRLDGLQRVIRMTDTTSNRSQPISATGIIQNEPS
jgi:hypothetical protein